MLKRTSFALCLLLFGCFTTPATKERVEWYRHFHLQQLTEAQKKVQGTEAQLKRAELSADATLILKMIGKELSRTIEETRLKIERGDFGSSDNLPSSYGPVIVSIEGDTMEFDLLFKSAVGEANKNK
ncbi:MAG: hypothetical protein ACI8X5_000482 [Planctomycetota bacterium]|jgi:hypothetical protein